MKAYITKYALSAGIQLVEGEIGEQENMLIVRPTEAGQFTVFYHGLGKEWHILWESAVAKAKLMQVAKIRSMRKKLAKLEAMEFDK